MEQEHKGLVGIWRIARSIWLSKTWLRGVFLFICCVPSTSVQLHPMQYLNFLPHCSLIKSLFSSHPSAANGPSRPQLLFLALCKSGYDNASKESFPHSLCKAQRSQFQCKRHLTPAWQTLKSSEHPYHREVLVTIANVGPRHSNINDGFEIDADAQSCLHTVLGLLKG
eukprot:1147131-Pelagomonas_calceolata.AAC.6